MLGDYERLGLPWRQALGGLMLVSLVGSGETGVREMAEAAREIFGRLGARRWLEALDAALARTSDRIGQSRPAAQVSVPDASMPAR